MNRVVFCFSELHNMYIDKYGFLTYLHIALMLFNYNECNQHFYVQWLFSVKHHLLLLNIIT